MKFKLLLGNKKKDKAKKRFNIIFMLFYFPGVCLVFILPIVLDLPLFMLFVGAGIFVILPAITIPFVDNYYYGETIEVGNDFLQGSRLGKLNFSDITSTDFFAPYNIGRMGVSARFVILKRGGKTILFTPLFLKDFYAFKQIFFERFDRYRHVPSMTQTISVKAGYEKTVYVGNIDIRLPKITGMVECFSLPMGNEWNPNEREETHPTLAFYINDDSYKELLKLNEAIIDEEGFDDFFKVSFQKKYINTYTDQNTLGQIVKHMEDTIIRKNLVDLKAPDLPFDTYFLMDSYSLDDNSKSLVLVARYDDSAFLVHVNSMVVVKNRLILISYTKNYSGENSIENASSRSDSFVMNFINVNK